MPMIIRNNIRYAGGSGGSNSGENIVELTQAEYDALGDVVNSDNITYYITDSDEQLDASGVAFDDTKTQLGASDVQGAISKLNSNITNVNIYVGDDNKLHFVDSEGADSVLPFNSSNFATFSATFSGSNDSLSSGNASTTIDITSFPLYKELTTSNFLIQINSYGRTYYSGSSGTTSHYTSMCRVTGYNASTGKLTLNSGKYGFGNTNSGAYFLWANNVTVIAFK